MSTFSITHISQRPWIPNLEEWESYQLIYLEAAAGNGSGKLKVDQYVYVLLNSSKKSGVQRLCNRVTIPSANELYITKN